MVTIFPAKCKELLIRWQLLRVKSKCNIKLGKSQNLKLNPHLHWEQILRKWENITFDELKWFSDLYTYS